MKVKKRKKNPKILAFAIFLIDLFKNMGFLAFNSLHIPIINIAAKLAPDTTGNGLPTTYFVKYLARFHSLWTVHDLSLSINYFT